MSLENDTAEIKKLVEADSLSPEEIARRNRISVATKAAMYRPDVQAKMHKPRSAEGAEACRKNFLKGSKRFVELYKGKTLDQIYGAEDAANFRKILKRGRLGRAGTRHSADSIAKIKKARFEQVVPNTNTIPEQTVERILVRNGIAYRKQWNVDYKMLVDFYLPDYGVMIFADGDFWHCHPRFRFADDQVVHHGMTKKQIVAKDDYHNKYLIQKGYKVLRFWEQDLKSNEANVEQAIKGEINNGKRQG